MSRLMLNLRDPSLVSIRELPTTDDVNLTYVESCHPTQMSDTRGFIDNNCDNYGRVSHRPSYGYLENPRLSAGKHK